MFWIICGASIAFICLMIGAVDEFYSMKKKALDSSVGLLPPSKQLLKEYEALPEDSRPFPEIIPLLKTIDKKYSYESDKVSNHFNSWYYQSDSKPIGGRFAFSWTGSGYNGCSRDHGNCKYPEYWKLHTAINEVAVALVNKEKRMLESSVDYAMLSDFTERLRIEADIQRAVTKEIS